jgi:PST family polysaccharide transporter
MNNKVNSYRRILKSSSIIGGASVINILIGLVRTKILAVLLGPVGVGLVGLYTGLMQTAATLSTMGLGTVGTRQIAEAISNEDARALAIARRAMLWGTLLLAGAGALVVWSSREFLAQYVLGSIEQSNIVGWLSLGVALSVVGASQGSLIQGMRRIGDMAKLSVYGSVLNTIFGLALLWYLEAAGLVVYVLVGPLMNFVLGHWYVSRLPKCDAGDITLHEMTQQWKILLLLGIPFMGAGLVSALVQLWIRIEVGNTLGAESLGYFQAAWMISMQYIGFVLGAMGADYFPRLTSVIQDHNAASRLVNEQTEIALLLSAPVFIAMIGLAPWIIQLLYSAAFMPAVEILRWQILGDVLKVASWPLGFVILAAGAGKTYFCTESFAVLLMGTLVSFFSTSMGLKITGIAFLACYLALLPLVYFLAKQRINFQWTSSVAKLLASVAGVCVFITLLCTQYWWGSIVSILLSLAFAFYTFVRLSHMSSFGGAIGKVAALGQRVANRLGIKIYER